MAKKVAVFNNKGGVSKTTTSTNVASILAKEPKNKVLLVDCDAQGNVLVSYGKNPIDFNDTIYDVIADGYPAEDAIYKITDNLHILPSNDDMDYLDQDIWTAESKYPVPFRLLRRALKDRIEPNYTHIIFDASPSMNLINMNILAYADDVIIPFELEETALKGIAKMVKKIGEFREKQNPNLKIGALLPVKVESRTNLHQMILKDIGNYAENKDIYMYEQGIPKTVKFAEAVTTMGQPATTVFSTNKAVKTYYDFVETLKEKDVL